jgi:hypothetical protein
MMWVLLAVILFCILIYNLFVVKRPSDFPPGPNFRVPILGSAIYLGKNPIKGVQKLRKQ